MQGLFDDETIKSRYEGAVCRCRMCGKYTKKVWEITATKTSVNEKGNQEIRTEEYALCCSCYNEIIRGFVPEVPINEKSDKEFTKELKEILAADKEE